MRNYDDELLDLRRQIFLTARKGGSAHLASCYSCLEILYALFLCGVMHYDPDNPNMPERDRLILSKGHAGLALYAVMCRAGFMTPEKLSTYLQPPTTIGGEPSPRDLPGIEAATGSLGHGLSVGAGIAMSQKIDGINARTFVIIGDGECQEGSIWESVISASAFGLDNLTAIIDCNGVQKMNTVEETMKFVDWQRKFEAFGWYVQETDGHDVNGLEVALKQENVTGLPRVLIAHTVKGRGVSIMENNPNWHFRMPNRKETKIFASELGIPQEVLN